MAGHEQQRHNKHRDEDETPDSPVAAPSTQARDTERTQQVDDLLAEIDTVLESNAEEFVHNFVQKGGQ